MDNLELLVKSLNKLENYTAKYIYKKYIEINTIPETAIPETTTLESTEDPEIIFKYSKKHPLHSETFHYHIIKNKKLHIKLINFHFSRVRANGFICPN